MAERDRIARQLAAIAREAGKILARMQPERPDPVLKADSSPVTAADHASEAVILQRLGTEFPDIPIVSEENAASHTALSGDRFFLVDPLDGTRAFIAGTPDFCVSIALVEKGLPVAGALHSPIEDWGVWAGETAWQAKGGLDRASPLDRVAPRPDSDPPVGLASQWHNSPETDRILSEMGVGPVMRMSSALKFIRLARGEADLYPRPTRTMQWDLAGGDAILRAMGGAIVDLCGRRPLRYGFGPEGWAGPPFLALSRFAG
jgi:3'(2'), 5'-bisphosphate nucleotidase